MRNHIPESRGNAGMWKSLHDSHIPTPLQVSFIPHRTSERSPYLVPRSWPPPGSSFDWNMLLTTLKLPQLSRHTNGEYSIGGRVA